MTTGDGVRIALAWLATYGLHSTLFLGGAWLLCTLRPPRADRNRERVWKLALVGGLISSSLQLGLGARPLLGSFDWDTAAAAGPAPQDALEVAARPALELHPGEPPPDPAARLPRETDPARPDLESALAASVPELERAPRTGIARGPQMGPPEPRREPRARPDRTGEAASARQETALVVRHPPQEPTLAARTAPLAPGRLARLADGLRGAARAGAERWPRLVLLGWTTVGLVGLVGLLASWTCLRRRLLGRALLRDGPLVAMLDELRARARVGTRVRLTVSPRIASPFSTGLLRPEICLPAAVLTDLGRSQQEALLAHELAHLVRRDPAWFGLGYLIEKLFFFQPLNRLARRRLCELAEVACDDWAVRWTGARVALASCLAEVAGWVLGERPRLVTPPGLAGHRSRLGQRVERLLDDRRSPSGDPPMPWWPPLAAGALALATLAVPGVSAASAGPASVAAPGARGPEELPAAPAPAGTATAMERAQAALDQALGEPLGDSLGDSLDEAFATPERGVLESELALLECELAALHAELEVRALRERFADELARIDARMAELRAQHLRVRELLARLARPNTRTAGPAPAAEAPAPTDPPAPTAEPGELR